MTLSIGQSAASVGSHPSLTDIVAPYEFAKGALVYVDQPFDLTYRQEGLAFNVPDTHTLWMTASDKKLTVIGIEPCPLYPLDFDAALLAVQQWKAREYIDPEKRGVVKPTYLYKVSINLLDVDRFDAP